MESSKQYMHPSLVLVNDEILSTQVRLMELYLKQAEAMAANEAARAQERFQTELTALQEELKQKEIALETQQALSHQADQNLRAEVQELRTRLLATQGSLQVRQTELDFARSDAHVLQQRIAQSESTVQKAYASIEIEVARARETWQEELSALEGQLERKESALQLLQASVKEVEGKLRAEILDLRSQLAAKAELLKNRTDELQNAQRETALLRRHMQQFALTGAQTETAASEAIRIRETLQAELASLRTAFEQKDVSLQQNQTATRELEERLSAQLHDLQNQLTEKQGLLDARSQEISELAAKTNDLQEQITCLELTNKQTVKEAKAAARAIEDSLRVRVQELEATASEKAQLLQNRATELENAQSETALLRQHIQQLELTGAQTEAAASEATRIRETLEAGLVVLRTAVEQKDLSLQQHQGATRELEERLTAQLHDLQRELAEKQELLEGRGQEVGELTAKTNDLYEQITCLELANKQTVKEAKAAARALEDSLRARVQELEASVSEKAQGLQNRTVELESAQSETALLRERIQQLELTGAQTEKAKDEADRRREALQNELGDVQRALEQKDRSFAQQEAEFKESNELLHAQLRNLQSQLTEERALLENQKREIHSARSEITALRDRVNELESAKAAAETNAFAGIERLREQYQLELTGLRAQLAQSQLVLNERQTTIRALEEELNSEIHRLEAQLAEKQTLLDRGQLELQEKGSEISALREEISQSEFARRQTEMLAATQAEQIRERVKAEVGALDAQLKEKESALKLAADRARELESDFNAKIADLQMQLAEKQSLMQGRDIELTDLRSQISNLLAQVNDLERTNAKALEQQRIAASRLEQDLHLQVTELQTQLAEKLAVLGTRNDEIQALESKITGLVKRIGQAEVAFKQAEATATSEIEQIRRQSQAELAAQQAESDRKAEALQQREAALYSAEQNRQLEINGLRAEVAEKHSLLENRNDELLRVKPELDAFQERIAYLESAARQAELESIEKAEHVGEQTSIELDKLWNELSQKERVLEERQVAVNDLEQNFQAQIDNLRSELAEKQALLENPSKGFLLGDPTLSESQKQKLNRLEQLVETIKADNEQTLMSAQNRRWRFSLGRKRRWKS